MATASPPGQQPRRQGTVELGREMPDKKKKKKEKAYTTHKGSLSYQGVKRYSRITLEHLVLRTSNDKDSVVLEEVPIKGLTVERVDEFLILQTENDQEYELTADGEDEAVLFEDGLNLNASLWESGEAETIKTEESAKKVRRERRKSVMDAVNMYDGMSDTSSPPQSPRTSSSALRRAQSADLEAVRKKEKKKRGRRPSTFAEKAAAEAARAEREEEEQGLMEQEEERTRLEIHIKELERKKKQAEEAKDLELTVARQEASEDGGGDLEIEELQEDLEALKEMIEESETESEALTEMVDELKLRSDELDVQVEQKLAENEEIQNAVDGGVEGQLSEEERQSKLQKAKNKSRADAEAVVAKELAQEIEHLKIKLKEVWPDDISSKMVSLEEQKIAAQDQLEKAEQAAEEAEQQAAVPNGADEDDDMLIAVAEAEDEWENIQEHTAAQVDTIERSTKSAIRGLQSQSQATDMADEDDSIRKQIKDAKYRRELARMKREESQIRATNEARQLAESERRTKDLQNQLGEIELELDASTGTIEQHIAEESESAVQRVVQQIEEDFRAEIEKLSAEAQGGIASRTEQMKHENERSLVVMQKLQEKIEKYKADTTSAQNRVDAAIEAEAEAEGKLDAAESDLREAQIKLKTQGRKGSISTSTQYAVSERIRKLRDDVASENKLEAMAEAALREAQREVTAAVRSCESISAERGSAKGAAEADLEAFRQQQESYWRMHFGSIESELQAQIDLKTNDLLEVQKQLNATTTEVQLMDGQGAEEHQLKGEIQNIDSELKRLSVEIANAEDSVRSAQTELTRVQTARSLADAQSQSVQENCEVTENLPLQASDARREAEKIAIVVDESKHLEKPNLDPSDELQADLQKLINTKIATARRADELTIKLRALDFRNIESSAKPDVTEEARTRIYNAKMVAEAHWSSYYAQKAGEMRSELAEETRSRADAERRAEEAEAEARYAERAIEERRIIAEERAQHAEDTLRMSSPNYGHRRHLTEGDDSPRAAATSHGNKSPRSSALHRQQRILHTIGVPSQRYTDARHLNVVTSSIPTTESAHAAFSPRFSPRTSFPNAAFSPRSSEGSHETRPAHHKLRAHSKLPPTHMAVQITSV
eukprot:SAG11_NODE_462_length_9229_cov_18.235926_3_plen_1119_part_00